VFTTCAPISASPRGVIWATLPRSKDAPPKWNHKLG